MVDFTQSDENLHLEIVKHKHAVILA